MEFFHIAAKSKRLSYITASWKIFNAQLAKAIIFSPDVKLYSKGIHTGYFTISNSVSLIFLITSCLKTSGFSEVSILKRQSAVISSIGSKSSFCC